MAQLAVPALKVEQWAKLPLYELKNTLIARGRSALRLLSEDAGGGGNGPGVTPPSLTDTCWSYLFIRNKYSAADYSQM